MSEMTTNADRERFQRGADDYTNYLKSPEGQLRLDLGFANLLDFLPQPPHSLRALDLGCGPGALAIRLARRGVHVTLLDSSPAMLDIANAAAREAGVTEKIALQHGDADTVAELFQAESFDAILCHNILEYVDNPIALLRGISVVLRDASAIVSVLVRNRAGEVLKAVIQAGDLAAAEQNLIAEWGHESLFGAGVRLFTADNLHAMLEAASLSVIAERGVRVFSDYLPPQISRSAEYERIFELERRLGRRPEFAAVARYVQCFAHRANAATGDGA